MAKDKWRRLIKRRGTDFVVSTHGDDTDLHGWLHDNFDLDGGHSLTRAGRFHYYVPAHPWNEDRLREWGKENGFTLQMEMAAIVKSQPSRVIRTIEESC